MTETDWLLKMATEPRAIKAEATQRAKAFEQVSVAKALVPEHLEQGWEIETELKRKSRLRRPWSHDKKLENRVWYLFYLLGYPEISAGRSFKVRIERKGAEPVYKQIDVLAKDHETVIVTECKSCKTMSKRSLQKDIEEFASLKGPISRAIKKHYGPDFKPKIIWMFVTHNIDWSVNDKQRAAGNNINVVTERELPYYLSIAEHLRKAARFQFLAEFLKNVKIPEMENVRVPAVKGKLGGQTFYSFVSTPQQMLKIAFVNHRTLNDPEGAPTYQRLIQRSRLKKISSFIERGGFFPTNILVNFSEKCRFEKLKHDPDTDVVFGHLYLPDKYRSAWVIDGQHRLYGYAPLSDGFLSQHVLIVAFEKLDKKKEAELFVTINHQQKTVPKNLLDELEGELNWESKKPSERIGAIAARLVNNMGNEIGGPLYERVVRQGLTSTERACLTVPELKAGLSKSRLIGSVAMAGKEYAPGPLSGVDDATTLERTRIVLTAYFESLAEANSALWEAGKGGQVCTNTSLRAHMRLLESLIAHVEAEAKLNARSLDPFELMSELTPYIEPITSFLATAPEAEITETFKVPFGSGGVPAYYYRLCRIVHQAHDAFMPDGFADWLEAQSEERVETADRQLKDLQKMVQKFIFDRLKEAYGVDNNAYWNKGISDKKIKSKAYDKSLDDETPLPLENYLDFIDYKKIVEPKEHWLLFKSVFDIPEPGEKGHARNLKWMDRINALRRIPAHPAENRNYTVADFEYIERIYNHVSAAIDAYEDAPTDESVPA